MYNNSRMPRIRVGKVRQAPTRWEPLVEIILDNYKVLRIILTVGILLQLGTIVVFERLLRANIEDDHKAQYFAQGGGDYEEYDKQPTIAGIEDQKQPFSFSACLLIKDNNIRLHEWLADHFTVLPLSRLIVTVDPLSPHTDPKPIFESMGMNITVWTNDSFWIDGNEVYEKKEFQITDETDHESMMKRYKHRQKAFFTNCLKQLHDERRTWTLFIDTDEYFAFNYYDTNEGPPTWCHGNATCAEEYDVKSIKDQITQSWGIRPKCDRMKCEWNLYFAVNS